MSELWVLSNTSFLGGEVASVFSLPNASHGRELGCFVGLCASKFARH